GSAHYAKEPVWPIESTVAMLNFDMVGRLRDNELIVNGVGTAEEFDAMLESVNGLFGFSLSTTEGGFGPSDHSSFYAKQVPVLHFFTGTHPEYHRPGDDFELLNLDGIGRVSRFVARLAERLADGDSAITYADVAAPEPQGGRSDPRPYFGSIPDFAGGGGGYALSGVTADSPAADAGIEGGDKIVKLGDFKIGNLEDFDSALRKFVAGEKVPVVVLREGEEVTLEVVLDPPR
ncbi:MAG: M28 family peptidase, partial [Planctomycetota bacterium]